MDSRVIKEKLPTKGNAEVQQYALIAAYAHWFVHINFLELRPRMKWKLFGLAMKRYLRQLITARYTKLSYCFLNEKKNSIYH